MADSTASNQAASLGAPRDRRKEKLLLSCSFCRTRKTRCDRALPCGQCKSRGIEASCTYQTRTADKTIGARTVHSRIQELEALVKTLLAQQRNAETLSQSTTHTSPGSSLSLAATPGLLTSSSAPLEARATSRPPITLDSTLLTDATPPGPTKTVCLSRDGTNYVGSVHWVAVLESIGQLRDHYEQDEGAMEFEQRVSSQDEIEHRRPRLLYPAIANTRSSILAAIPARAVVDRMVARYFNTQGAVPEIVHTSQFLRQYAKFWEDSSTTPLAWVGLLFSIMCVSKQYERNFSTEENHDHSTERLFQDYVCNLLVLSGYTKGGDYILETMVNYLASEILLPGQDPSDTGLWLVLGSLVQLSLSQGYHRDPTNFPSISPFAAEMRRRLWMVIVQFDLRLSSFTSRPRLLKSQDSDTREPRNLFNSDFDEDMSDLPPARPDVECTPILYSIAKSRIDKVGTAISDLTNDTTQERTYDEILLLDERLQAAEASLPPMFQWQPLSSSFMDPPQVLMHRILLQLGLQRMTIGLHRDYFCMVGAPFARSRQVCVQAASKILDLQRIIDEETQPDRLLHSVRRMFQSSAIQAIFMLGASVLLYVIKKQPELLENSPEIPALLHRAYMTWSRSQAVSPEIGRAVEQLRKLLGIPATNASRNYHSNDFNKSNQVNNEAMPDPRLWEAIQSYPTEFPASTTSNVLAPMAMDTMWIGDTSIEDMTQWDDWMDFQKLFDMSQPIL